MRVEGQTGCAPQRFYDRQTDGQIGHEMTVHYVAMDDGRAARFGRSDLLAQPRKISRQNRRSDFNHDLFSCFAARRRQALRASGLTGPTTTDLSSYAQMPKRKPALLLEQLTQP